MIINWFFDNLPHNKLLLSLDEKNIFSIGLNDKILITSDICD
jgi:hypothetical protein